MPRDTEAQEAYYKTQEPDGSYDIEELEDGYWRGGKEGDYSVPSSGGPLRAQIQSLAEAFTANDPKAANAILLGLGLTAAVVGAAMVIPAALSAAGMTWPIWEQVKSFLLGTGGTVGGGGRGKYGGRSLVSTLLNAIVFGVGYGVAVNQGFLWSNRTDAEREDARGDLLYLIGRGDQWMFDNGFTDEQIADIHQMYNDLIIQELGLQPGYVPPADVYAEPYPGAAEQFGLKGRMGQEYDIFSVVAAQKKEYDRLIEYNRALISLDEDTGEENEVEQAYLGDIDTGEGAEYSGSEFEQEWNLDSQSLTSEGQDAEGGNASEEYNLDSGSGLKRYNPERDGRPQISNQFEGENSMSYGYRRRNYGRNQGGQGGQGGQYKGQDGLWHWPSGAVVNAGRSNRGGGYRRRY